MSRGERSTAQRTPLKAAAAATHTGKIARARAQKYSRWWFSSRATVFFLFLFLFFLRFFQDNETRNDEGTLCRRNNRLLQVQSNQSEVRINLYANLEVGFPELRVIALHLFGRFVIIRRSWENIASLFLLIL